MKNELITFVNEKFAKEINHQSFLIFHFSSEKDFQRQKIDKKIPAGYPAGEGGMVEEIYIHYCRHLVREKVTPFWKKNARNCSGEFF